MVDTVEKLRGLVLSAIELRSMTDWPEALIEDYLNIIENLITIAGVVDIEVHQKLEEIETDFLDGSVLFTKVGFAQQDNPNFTWDNILNKLNINGTISGKNRAKQYFFAGF